MNTWKRYISAAALILGLAVLPHCGFGEASADPEVRGIVLTGGGALLYGMAELLQQETGTPTVVADDPMSCVALGCGKALDIFDKFDGKATNTSFGRKK